MKRLLLSLFLLSSLAVFSSTETVSTKEAQPLDLGDPKSPTFQSAIQNLFEFVQVNDTEGFNKEWNKYSESNKTRLAKYKEHDTKASLLSYTSYIHFRDKTKVKKANEITGDIAKTLCKYAPEQTNALFFDQNSGTIRTVLEKAITRGFTKLALDLLHSCNANPNIVASSASPHSLLLAAMIGNLELFQEIASRVNHISNDIVDQNQNTALWYAENGQKLKAEDSEVYSELDNQHHEIIKILKSKGVDRHSMLGCKVLSFSDLIHDDLASNSVFLTKEKQEEQLKNYIPKYERTLQESKDIAVKRAIEQCQSQGFEVCEVASLATLHHAGLHQANENPVIQTRLITKRVNFGTNQYPAERVIGIEKRISYVFVYGLEKGTSVEQCPLIK